MTITQSISLNEVEVTRFFLALLLLLVSSHTCGYLFTRSKMPKVIGEIFGGLLLGPSVLGYFFPSLQSWLFSGFTAEPQLLASMYWIGLILLMFISGFEIQKSVKRGDVKVILAILLGGTAIPFLVGWTAPNIFDFSSLLGTQQNMLAFTLVMGIAMAVTSIPVISKIFLDLQIIKTRFARIVLSAATVEDIILWVALAIATGLVNAQDLSLSAIVSTVFITLSFFLLGLLVLPRIIRLLTSVRVNLLIQASVYGYVLFLLLFFTVVAGLLHINIVFGAFLAGILVNLAKEERFTKVKSTIHEIGIAFFIPIYFAIVGLKLDLIHHLNPVFFAGFFVFATFFKTLGTFVGARIVKKDLLSCFNLAVAMNTRGGPGIVLATVAFDMGIISEEFFVTLVLLAVITSLLAGYWFSFILSRKLPLLR